MSARKLLTQNEIISLLDEDLSELSKLSDDDDDDVQMSPKVVYDESENDAEVCGKVTQGANVVLTVDQIPSITTSRGDRNTSASRSGP